VRSNTPPRHVVHTHILHRFSSQYSWQLLFSSPGARPCGSNARLAVHWWLPLGISSAMALEPQFPICSLRPYSRLMIHQPYIEYLPNVFFSICLSMLCRQYGQNPCLSAACWPSRAMVGHPLARVDLSPVSPNQQTFVKWLCAVNNARLLPALVSAKVLMLFFCYNHIATVLLGRSSLLHMIDGLTPPSISSIISSFRRPIQVFCLFSGRHDCSRLTRSSVHYG